MVCLGKKNAKPKDYVEIGVDAEDYYKIMDNDYLCYDLEKKGWTMYNIVDNVKFDPRKEIYDYLQ